MVNTGLPSRDCHTCRRRRVKCDLRRPGCYRCEKIGQECTGYRDLENRGLVFRVHTPSSYVARKQQKTCERSSVTSEEQSNANQNHSLAALDANWAEQGYPEKRLSDLYRMFRSSPWSPSRQLLESWDMHIIPLIVSQFSFPRPGGGRVYGSLECFPHLLQHVETDSVLYLACHAVGYAYLANKSRTSGTALSHQSRYGKALYALRLALRDTELQKRDSTLLAVWLLCFYELVKEDIEDSKVGPVNYDIHSKALVGLLRLRGRQQFRSKTGCQVFQLAYHTIQINSIQTRCDPPSEAPQWFSEIQASDSVTNVNFIPLFSLCDDAVRISSTAKALVEKAALEDMFFSATFVAEASKDLESRMQDHFGQIVTLPSMNSAAEFIVANDHINIHNLRIRNYVDACFLRLHYSVLELLFHTAKFQSHSIDQFEEITALRDLTILQTQARSERILSTLPIFLQEPSHQTEEEKGACISNWADALRLLWQVRLIAASPFVLERQKMAAKSALAKIGHEIGLMQALGSYYLTLTAYINL